ncbi:hypothetical protein E2562_004634 [Oryza meyeriana var. granulata]|uniref:Uncharacterized protein n=1 Tax=Oryza meyeriana var. granulata TaxID=110450 RepID=A0A6G1DDE5_9ORYZ|nr:hypothetical protein E2562_004634 [Oryza meyeriana var. granulata]
MADKRAAKKVQALQHLEERFKRRIAKRLDREDKPTEDIRLYLRVLPEGRKQRLQLPTCNRRTENVVLVADD